MNCFVAEYTLRSRFEVPEGAKDITVHWDKISYTTKDGVDVEDQEPIENCQEDHEAFHRPTDTWIECAEEDDEEPPQEFYDWAKGKSASELVEMLWMRMSMKERRETIKEFKEPDEEEEDESSQ